VDGRLRRREEAGPERGEVWRGRRGLNIFRAVLGSKSSRFKKKYRAKYKAN
jgi:hypothetical protein